VENTVDFFGIVDFASIEWYVSAKLYDVISLQNGVLFLNIILRARDHPHHFSFTMCYSK